MLRSRFVLCLLLVLLAAPGAAQVGRRPGANQPAGPGIVTPPPPSSGSYTGLGMKRRMLDPQTESGDIEEDGVENACGFFWTTGRGLLGPNPPGFHAIYQFDLTGNLVAIHPQVNPGGSAFGHRDMSHSHASMKFWMGEENGELSEYSFNTSPPPNGTLTFVQSYVIPGVGQIRALTHDPIQSSGGTDVFLTADLNGPIHVFSINPVQLLNTFTNPGKAFSGFGFDEINGIVWAYSQNKPSGVTPPDLSQVNGLNPANGQLIPGLVFQGVPFPGPNVASGATVFRDPLFPCSLSLAVITQSNPDMLVTYDLAVPTCAPPEKGINVDIGVNTTHPLPSQTYGAASGPLSQPGFWNPVPGSQAVAGPVPLFDTAGNPTPVTLRAMGGLGDFQFDNPNTTGNEDRLLDDLYDAGNSQWVFSGLNDGEYAVYVYAWAPDAPLTFLSDVTIHGGMKGTVTVGRGEWQGVYIDGVHFSYDMVSICGGTDLVIDVMTTPMGTPTSVNGFQIVPQGASHCALTYCTAKSGLTCGLPAISTYGAPSATNTAGFLVKAGPARSCKSGVLLYNTNSIPGLPFQGGTLCIDPMGLRRAGSTNSLGTPGNNCDGEFSMDMNQFAQLMWMVPGCNGSPVGLTQHNPAAFLLTPGLNVFAQYWGRDALATGSFLSDAVTWVIGP